MEGGWITLAVAVIMSLPGVLAFFSTRRKDHAEAAGQITDAAMDIVGELRKQLQDANARAAASEAWARRLAEQLEAAGIMPQSRRESDGSNDHKSARD